MSKTLKTRHGRRVKKEGAQGAMPAQPERESANHALFGLAQERGVRDRQAEASVEDPLDDWPDVPEEADRWLLERVSPDQETPPDSDEAAPDKLDR